MKKIHLYAAAAWLALASSAALADDTHLFVPQWLGAQYTLTAQHQSSLHSPYASDLSLLAHGDTARSHTFGAYFGVALPAHLQFYLDVEMFKGAGVSGTSGLGGLTNGDAVRSGSAGLGKTPYVARRFLRWTLPLDDERVQTEQAKDQLSGDEALRRIEVKLGKMAINDDFDKNRYAGDTRTQFMNWALFNNPTWDFAADTRGYTDGLMVGWITPSWSLRYGVYRMPYEANGQRLESSLRHARGEQIELTLQPHADGWAVRLLGFRNTARMGVYRDAIALASTTGTVPDIRADDRPGRRKFGYAVNAELPLADQGDTGLFARAGWNDGHTESFAFAEVDRTLSGGIQLSGAHWGRPTDHLGIAFAINGLSAAHRDYLALGGKGFTLGDGALSYGHERIIEAYYSYAVFNHFTLSPDIQLVRHPGYNRDRGPARFIGLRAHLEL